MHLTLKKLEAPRSGEPGSGENILLEGVWGGMRNCGREGND